MNIKNFFITDAYAHCDIPCGIYDPHAMQVAAHTVIRMTQLLQDSKDAHDISRMTHVKEKHGEAVEEELGTLENDYFKSEHYEKFPELKSLISDAVKLSVSVRQHVDLEASKNLLEKILQIAEIFYKTKGVIPVRVKSLYPTESEIVTYNAS